jgi:hypothetical protein
LFTHFPFDEYKEAEIYYQCIYSPNFNLKLDTGKENIKNKTSEAT